MQEQVPRLDSLQALRALAFLGVLTSHCGVSELGAWGVSVFFILSGFVMIYNYLPRRSISAVSLIDNWRFSVRKISKLYSLHILMLVLMLFLLVFEHKSVHYLSGAVIEILLNILLLQAWVPQGSIYFSLNGVAWYLSCCVFLYFAFPYILKKISKYTAPGDAWRSIVCIAVLQVAIGFLSSLVSVPKEISNNFAKWVTYVLPLYRVGDFMIGCNIGYFYIHRKGDLQKASATCAELVTFVLIGISRAVYIAKNGGVNGFATPCCLRLPQLP